MTLAGIAKAKSLNRTATNARFWPGPGGGQLLPTAAPYVELPSNDHLR